MFAHFKINTYLDNDSSAALSLSTKGKAGNHTLVRKIHFQNCLRTRRPHLSVISICGWNTLKKFYQLITFNIAYVIYFCRFIDRHSGSREPTESYECGQCYSSYEYAEKVERQYIVVAENQLKTMRVANVIVITSMQRKSYVNLQWQQRTN